MLVMMRAANPVSECYAGTRGWQQAANGYRRTDRITDTFVVAAFGSSSRLGKLCCSGS